MLILTIAVLSVSGTGMNAKTLTGWLKKSAYRIDIPDKGWNKSLVMYCHGLRLSPITPDQLTMPTLLKSLLDEGYATAQAGYSGSGVEEGVQDTELLREFFSQTIGEPVKVFIVGESLGGFFVPVLLERQETPYSGGLALCAPLMSSEWFVMRRMLDLRVVFDFLFPGVLPALDGKAVIAKDEDLSAKAIKALEQNPEKAKELVRYSGLDTNQSLASAIEIYTYLLLDIRRRAAGNAFDNQGVIYQGTSQDVALNRGATRYVPDINAVKYLTEYYTLSGDLKSPLLAMNNVSDPLIPAWINNFYPLQIRHSGKAKLFVQRPALRAGHCNLNPDEVHHAFVDLVQWETDGVFPARVQP
jgi:hypothetical protein